MENIGKIPSKLLIISSDGDGKGVKLWKKCLLLWTFEYTKVDLTRAPACPAAKLESALFQHPRCDEFFFDVTLEGLDQEFAEIGSLGFGPRRSGESLYRGAEHLCGQGPRLT